MNVKLPSSATSATKFSSSEANSISIIKNITVESFLYAQTVVKLSTTNTIWKFT